MVKRRIEIVDPAEGQKQYQAIVANGHDISRTVGATQSERLFNADTRYRTQGNHYPFPVCRKQSVVHHVANGIAEGIPLPGVRYESTRQLVTHPTGQFAFKRPLPALSPAWCLGI